MLSYYYNFLYFMYCFSLMLMFAMIFMYLESMNYSYFMVFMNFMNFDFNNMEIIYFFNKSSILFSMAVLFISSFIYVYSYYYLGKMFKTNYYCFLLFIFVISMIYTINCNSLLFVMLGWDGLGFSSYLLVCYYMNDVSLSNAMFTLMTNRLGDIFLLLFIIFLQMNMLNFYMNYMLVLLMMGLMTKSAIFLFSNWLLAAMSALTLVSALVHSSTLVTSGLWLMMRNYFYIMNNLVLMKLLLIISLFTIFYSGMNTIYEMDMKKLIALSTLSHMGFICFGISLGLINLAFLHLIIHALFKSMLFMAMGMIIANNEHYQDIRYISSGSKINLFSYSMMYFSIICLLGMLMMNSYYSKDLMLEMMSFTNNFYLNELTIYLLMFFSFYYSMKLFYYCSSSLNSNLYKIFNKINLNLMMFMIIMMIMNIIFFKLMLNIILLEYIFFCLVNFTNKLLLFLMMFVMILMYLFMNNIMNFNLMNYMYFNTMMNLNFIFKNMSISLYYMSLGGFMNNEYIYNKFMLLESKKINNMMFTKMYNMMFISNLFMYLLILMFIMFIM